LKWSGHFKWPDHYFCSMPILLCAATDFEIKPTIDFINSRIPGTIEVLITGLGLTAATYQLTKSVTTKKPTLVIQAGIAGYFDENLRPGDVVGVRNECIGDLGVFEKGAFRSLFDMNFLAINSFPWTGKKLVNKSSLLVETGLKITDAVSVSEITTSAERISYYKKEMGAQVESMEGAALHYVCLLENIPFLQMRSLSNFVGERDKSKWLIQEAIASLNSELQRIILKFQHQ
jgi:futalosine hydrolase